MDWALTARDRCSVAPYAGPAISVATSIARGTLERPQDSSDARMARLYPTPAAYAARDAANAWGEPLSGSWAELARADRRPLAGAAPALRHPTTPADRPRPRPTAPG